MLKNLFNLKGYWREGSIGVLVVVVLYLLLQWKQTDADLKKARLSFENPQIKEVIREVRVKGPIKTIYRTIKEPGEREIVERIVYRDAEITTKDNSSESTPIPPDNLIKASGNRWLLSGGINRFSVDKEGKAVFVGYGFNNRLDFQVGVVEKNGTSPWGLVTVRF